MKEVILYTQPDCPPCQIMKYFFSENNVEYVEKNIKQDKKAFNELTKQYGSYTTPTVIIDGKAIIGFELDEVEKALEL
ncbi:glutaredoxin family protein [Bacillus massiliglaciei]|uniref:glutaredoxin family protein n=1 Tax=Bacillus massiliglaciei TaxID=1816693 RepID=UPI000DA615D5|nr:glutaredoxin family protein [Bacillus massiliglaciei]